MSEPSREALIAMIRRARVTVIDQWEGAYGYVPPDEAATIADAILALRAAKPERERVITDEMIEAGCRARHSVRAWNRQLNNADMTPWVKSRREEMRTILTAALKGDPASTVAHLPNVVVTKQEW